MTHGPLIDPQRISFDPRFKAAILAGSKTLTTRKLGHRARAGDLLLCVSPESGRPGRFTPKKNAWALITVVRIFEKAPVDLTLEEVHAEGFSDPLEYQKVVQEKNPGIDLSAPMTLIRFELVQSLTPERQAGGRE